MLLVVVLGYRIGGMVGGLIALLAFFLPMSIAVMWVGRFLSHLRPSPWKRALRDGLAPVTIGLMASGAYAMGRSAVTTWPALLVALVVFGVMISTKINPVFLVIASAIFGAFFFTR
jgi:chromate transporter